MRVVPGGTKVDARNGAAAPSEHAYFSLGRWAVPVNVVAVVWGICVVINISWPRAEIYGLHPWGRFAGPLATLALIALGAAYYVVYQRKRSGILPVHAAEEVLDVGAAESKNQSGEHGWIGRHAPGEREAVRP